MAFQLAQYNLCGVPVPDAYFVITGALLDLTGQTMQVATAIWADQASAAGEVPFLPSTDINYTFTGDGLAAALEASPQPGVGGVVPTQVVEIVLANLYSQLLGHPLASLVLAGATAV